MQDFLSLDTQFSQEEILIRDSVKRFVADEVIPLMTDSYENGVFPT